MWDFAKVQLSFVIANKEIVLRGECIADDKLVGEVEVNREVRKCKKRDGALIIFSSKYYHDESTFSIIAKAFRRI